MASLVFSSGITSRVKEKRDRESYLSVFVPVHSLPLIHGNPPEPHAFNHISSKAESRRLQ